MKARPYRLVLGLVCLLAFVGGANSAVPNGPSLDLVISEVYGAGGNSGSDYPADYVELFNRGTTTVSLDGKSLQYASATGTGAFSSITSLSGTIEPGQYVLVQAAGAAPVTADITLVASMGATAGKVALANGTATLACNSAASCAANGNDTRIIDLVGYGTPNTYFEGAGPALGASTIMSTKRAGEGCVETDNNGGDFAANDQDPDNRASTFSPCGGPPPPPVDLPPTVTTTNPPNGAANVDRNGNITVTFSEPVTASDSAFVLSCNGTNIPVTVTSNAEGTIFTLDPATELPAGAACTVTVRASGVSDQDATDPPDQPAADYTFAFTTTGIEGLRIHDIQDHAHISPYDGALVSQVPGVVTAVTSNGFYFQDPEPDADVRTSEGIFVFTGSSTPLLVGTAVRVSGRVQEFRVGCFPTCAPSASAFANLTTTEIVTPASVAMGPAPAIPATVVGRGGRVPPTTVIENDSSGDVETSNIFDVQRDGIDFYESLEGMLVQINKAVVVGPRNGFGEIPVLSDSGSYAGLRTNRGGILVRKLGSAAYPHDYEQGDFNPERIILDDVIKPTPSVDVRDRFTTPVRAVVDYGFGNFKFLVLDELTPVDGGLTRERTRAHRRDELAIATFNVENLSANPATNPPAKFAALAGLIVNNLRSPDLLAIEEIQDNDGAGSPAPSDATLTWRALIAAIQAVGGPTYDYRQIDPVPGEDGGQPGGNIRVGFLFRTDRGLSFVDRPGGTAVNATHENTAVRGAQLTFSPGRVDPTNTAFTDSRKPLAGEFRWRGETFFAVANHFNSKGGDQPLFGRFQPPQRSSEVQRHQQAAIVNAFVDEILAADKRAKIVVLGDINDFQFSTTTAILKGRVLTTLVDTLPKAERYTYVFDGNSQVLDQILVSKALLGGGDDDDDKSGSGLYDVVHVNAEFVDQDSDHDPSVMRATFGGDRDDDDDNDDDNDDDDDDDDDDSDDDD